MLRKTPPLTELQIPATVTTLDVNIKIYQRSNKPTAGRDVRFDVLLRAAQMKASATVTYGCQNRSICQI